MRSWRTVVALAVIAAGVWTVREAGQQAAERPASPSPASPTAGPAAPDVRAPAPRLLRDPFRYVEPAREAARALPPERREAVAEPTPAPVPELRLSGFVRSGGALRAVLALGGSLGVAAPGDSFEGYRVLAVDEDAGVRVKTPAGEEILLSPRPR